MFDKKYHWYMITFIKVDNNGSSWGIVNTYIGNPKPHVSKRDITLAREYIECDLNAIYGDNRDEDLATMSVSYVGRMTSNQFNDGDA